MAEETNYANQYYSDIASKMRDLEEKQRILKDRLILVGDNLIEIKEKTTEEMLDIKKDLEGIRSTVDRLKSFIETISGEFSQFARKEDLDILTKQAKMFQPLEFVRKSDLPQAKGHSQREQKS